jgi:hypothetical protein
MHATKCGDREALIEADVQLALLKRRLRMAKELSLLNLGQYEHAARMSAELGRLLGAWLAKWQHQSGDAGPAPPAR